MEFYTYLTLLKLIIIDGIFFAVPRIQFLAIEIARNREGYNSGLQMKRTEWQ